MAGTNRRRLSNDQRGQLRLARDNARSCAENLVRHRYIDAERDCRLCSLALERLDRLDRQHRWPRWSIGNGKR
jgi:hypothetical protein